MSFQIMGYLAIFFTTVSFLPQAIKTLKTRRVGDLSLITYLFLFLGSLSWFLYGSYLNDFPLMATNSMTTVLTGLILFLIMKEKKSTI
jgi:MtN3 and saliva related transmembrane protein